MQNKWANNFPEFWEKKLLHKGTWLMKKEHVLKRDGDVTWLRHFFLSKKNKENNVRD